MLSTTTAASGSNGEDSRLHQELSKVQAKFVFPVGFGLNFPVTFADRPAATP